MEISHEEVLLIAGGLVAAITALWFEIRSNAKSIREDYTELKEDHKNCNENIRVLYGKIERISGEHEGIEKISEKVIEELRNNNSCKYKSRGD